MLCKVSLGFLFLLAAVSFLTLTAVAANKTKQPSNNMVSQVAFCEEHACYSKTNDTDAQINSMRHTLYDQISIFCFFRRDLSSFHKAINCIFYILNEKSDTIVKKRETYDVVSVQIT